MKLYFAGVDCKAYLTIVSRHNQRALGTYYSLKNRDMSKYLKNLRSDFFLDSGAFTAFTQNKKIDLKAYCDFIKKNKKSLALYASLDVIGDWKATRKNQEFMEKQGLKPLATFHHGSPLSELRRLIAKYDYIALGGLVPLTRTPDKLKKWLDICFSIIKVDTKVHGFGINSFNIWKRYPFYSVDATSWLSPSKFKRFLKFDNGQASSFGSLQRTQKKDEIIRLDLETKHYTELCDMQIQEYMKMEKFVTRLWEQRGIVW